MPAVSAGALSVSVSVSVSVTVETSVVVTVDPVTLVTVVVPPDSSPDSATSHPSTPPNGERQREGGDEHARA